MVWSLGDEKSTGWHGIARSLPAAWDAVVHLIKERPPDEWDWRFSFDLLGE